MDISHNAHRSTGVAARDPNNDMHKYTCVVISVSVVQKMSDQHQSEMMMQNDDDRRMII